jgi:predicted DNA-binding protein with PD1-like motif
MKSREVAGGYVVRLDRGEEAIASLTAFVKEKDIPCGFLQGIGSIRNVELGYFDTQTNEYRRRRFADTVEVVSMTGDISWLHNEPSVHTHAAVAGPDHNVVGGHFFSGTVAVTLEIFIRVFPEKLTRTADADSGFNPWNL